MPRLKVPPLPGVGTCLCGDFRFGAFLSYLQNSLGISSNLGVNRLGLDVPLVGSGWMNGLLSYHGPPKPTFLEVFMVNNLVLGGQNLLFFMLLRARGTYKSGSHWGYNPLILQ